MKLTTLLTLLTLLPLALIAEEKPNIVLIYADDLGFGDVSCNGATAVQTPNIDRIAKEGLNFTAGYATSATCTPSRFSLLTGKYAWRQKGTGRARAGMTSSPLWRGGGKIFPNSPDENFSHKLNRRMYRAGMASILSQLAREDRIRVVDEFKVDAPKTKLLAQKVKAMGFDEVLVLTEEVDQNLQLASRNLENVQVMSVRNANPAALVRWAKVLLTRGAVARLEELLK